MSLKHGLLGLLNYEEAMTGYDLDRFFKNSLNHFWSAKTSQIYRELNSMEERGLLTSERIMQEERPNKRVYSITDAGKKELVNWLISADLGLNYDMKSIFLMKVFFAGEIGKDEAIRLIISYKEVLCSALTTIKEAQSAIAEEQSQSPSEHSVYWSLTALHGEISLKAGIEWADKALEILKNIPK